MSVKKNEYGNNEEVRWCPGCGDYAILANLQRALAHMAVPKEKLVFISGIGCAGRLPYYMDANGFHTIHGRAPTIATGLKIARPDLSVWIITGDGDGFSIGTNHLIHLARRNIDVNVLIFNNQVYGLTKGQYSPTSALGQVSKTSPLGSVEFPIEPLAILHAAGASMIARAIDTDAKHLQSMLESAYLHQGAAFLEIYQNCHIYNDGAFANYRDKALRDNHLHYIQPDDFADDGVIYKKIHDRAPLNVGVFYKRDRPCLESSYPMQMKDFDLFSRLKGRDSWSMD